MEVGVPAPEGTLSTVSPGPETAVRCEGVAFDYGRSPVLRSISFTLAQGEMAYLVGPSGTGKTTLLRLIHGQLRPGKGELTVAGIPLHRPRRGAVQRVRRRVGVVFQDYKLLQRLTALENVSYALRVANLRLGSREARRRAEAMLRDVGLEERMQARSWQLSGGQQQRVAIARALAAGPAVLLADEPTASLDDDNAANVSGLLERIAGDGTTVLVATCDRDLAGAPQRRTLRLVDGELEESQTANGKVRSPEIQCATP
jgi:cell division transport system ATP-binding protein